MARAILVLTATVAAVAATALPAQAKEKPPTVVAPPPTPHVGFYTVHPRVGLSTYYSLSASWPRTQAPLRVIAKVHPAGGTCAADPASDTGTAFGAAWLTRADHHTVWKEWTPAEPGSYVVCTWLGNPVIATNTNQVTVEPRNQHEPGHSRACVPGSQASGDARCGGHERVTWRSASHRLPDGTRACLRAVPASWSEAGQASDDRISRHEWPRRPVAPAVERTCAGLVPGSHPAPATRRTAGILARERPRRQPDAWAHPLPHPRLRSAQGPVGPARQVPPHRPAPKGGPVCAQAGRRGTRSRRALRRCPVSSEAQSSLRPGRPPRRPAVRAPSPGKDTREWRVAPCLSRDHFALALQALEPQL
jgi:hypothetical protein